jgi:hypothetical protein
VRQALDNVSIDGTCMRSKSPTRLPIARIQRAIGRSLQKGKASSALTPPEICACFCGSVADGGRQVDPRLAIDRVQMGIAACRFDSAVGIKKQSPAPSSSPFLIFWCLGFCGCKLKPRTHHGDKRRSVMEPPLVKECMSSPPHALRSDGDREPWRQMPKIYCAWVDC